MKSLLQFLIPIAAIALVCQWGKPSIDPQQAAYSMGGVHTGMSRSSLMEFLGQETELEHKEWGFCGYCRLCGRRNFEEPRCLVHEGQFAMAIITDDDVDLVFSGQVEQDGEPFLKTGDSLRRVRQLLGPERKEHLEEDSPAISLKVPAATLLVEIEDECVSLIKLIDDEAFE